MDSKKQIKWGAILSYISIALNIVAGLIYTPWMVNQIGQSHYGLYTLANSLITLFIVDFGLGSATTRYISKYRAEGNEQKVNEFLGAIYKLYLIIDAIIFCIFLVLFFFLDKIYVNLTPQELEEFRIVYLIAAVFAILHFPFIPQNGILTAYEKFVAQKIVDIIYRILIVGLTVLFLLLDFGLYALVSVNAVVGLIVIIIKLIILKTTVPAKADFKTVDTTIYKEIFKFSIWVTVSLFAQRLVFNITPSILGITANSIAIAIFGVIITIEGYSYTITTAINGMFMPKISRIYANSNQENQAEENIQPLFLNVGRFQYALNGLIVVGFALVGKQFISLWMGPGYHEAYWGILLVIVPGLFYNSLQIANTTMVVQNKVKLQAFINVLTGITNVILSFILSSFIGVIGACISIFTAYSLRAIIMNIISGKVLKFDMGSFIINCYLRMSVPIILTFILAGLINYFIPNTGWLSLIVQAVIVVVIYLLFICIFALKKEERNSIFSKITKKLSKKEIAK